MKSLFSIKWKASKQPRKQRKYRLNAPLHVKQDFLNACLSDDLSKKHGVKKLRVILGDKVKVMRGKYKGKEGKVDVVDTKKSRVKITGLEITKKDGSKAKMPIHASNLMIVDLKLDDKKRIKKK